MGTSGLDDLVFQSITRKNEVCNELGICPKLVHTIARTENKTIQNWLLKSLCGPGWTKTDDTVQVQLMLDYQKWYCVMKSLQCEMCGKFFDKQGNLRDHVKSIHSNYKTF